MTDLTVARSILDQLGGARFVAMTGARELVGSAERQVVCFQQKRPEFKPSAVANST